MVQQKSLLEIAKETKSNRKNISKEEIELAIAIMKNEISIQQANVALTGSKSNHSNIQYWLGRALCQCYSRGIISLNESKLKE